MVVVVVLGGRLSAVRVASGQPRVADALHGRYPVPQADQAREASDERVHGLVADRAPQDRRGPAGYPQRRHQQVPRTSVAPAD